MEGSNSLLPPNSLNGKLVQVEWFAVREKYRHKKILKCSNLETDRFWNSFLLQIAGNEIEKCFKILNLPENDILKFDNILSKAEDVLLPLFLLVYNRYKFFEDMEYSTDTCEDHAKQLKRLFPLCEFEGDNNIITQEIAKHITEPSLHKMLLQSPHYDFQTILKICQAQDNENEARNLLPKDLEPLKSSHALNDACQKTASVKLDFEEDLTSCDSTNNRETKSLPSIKNNEKKTLKPVRKQQTAKQHYVYHTPKVRSIKGSVSSQQNLADNKRAQGDQNTFVEDTQQRPKRKICIPERLKSDAGILKLLKFTEERRAETGGNIETADMAAKKCKNVKNNNTSLSKIKTSLTKIRTLKCRTTLQSDKIDSQKINIRRLEKKDMASKTRQRKMHSSTEKKTEKATEKISHQVFKYRKDIPVLGGDFNSEISTEEVKSVSKPSSFQCVKCNLNFENSALLNTHVLSHSGIKRFTCSVCKTGFTMLKLLVAHKKEHCINKTYICDMCGKSFSQLVNLRCHLRIHTGEKPYKCPHCDKMFTWKAAKRRHIRLHTGERPYACEFCSKRFIDFCGWQNHTRTHTQEKPYHCGQCGFRTNTPGAMTIHTRIHTGEKPYHCELCNKAFQSSGKLTVHMKLHHGVAKPKNIICEVCGKRFECPSNLKLHSRKHTGEKPYKCLLCEAAFGWLAALKRHERTHSKMKPYSCEICHRSFADKPYLNRHKMSHTGERPFKCDLCPSTFVVSYDLHQHKKIHTSDKKFVCEVCGMSFVRKCYLYKHKRIHFGVKSHQCETCGKKFFEPNRLRDHMKRHEKQKLKPPPGSKHHLCSTCGKGFAKKAYLIKHVMTHTGNKPYVCTVCGAKFVDSFKLKRHKNIHNCHKPAAQDKGAEILAIGQLGIKILTDAAEQVNLGQERSLLEVKEEVIRQVIDTSPHIIIQQEDEIKLEEVQLQAKDQSSEEAEKTQQIIISPQQSLDANHISENQPYKVIILEVWSPP